MLHLNVTAETPEELKATLLALASSLNTTTPENHLNEPVEEPPAQEAAFPPADIAGAPIQEQREEDNTPPAPTMEEARAALNALRQKKGAAAVREVLKKHGVSSFTELSPDDYPQVMEEAGANAAD